MLTFNTGLKFGKRYHTLPTGTSLKNLPQVYRGDLQFTRLLRGFDKGWQRLLDILEDEMTGGFDHVSIDTRAHMLQPGWYPCIPGWHCDDFYRPNGQPDLEQVPYQRHIMVVLGASSLPEFITEPLTMHPVHTKVYEHYNSKLEQLDELEGLKKEQVEPGRVIVFGPRDFHRGLPATEAGWRYFIRLTQSNHREPTNELRTQTQVYLTETGKGW